MRRTRRCLFTLATFLLVFLALGYLPPAALAQANVTGQWRTLPNLMPINPVHVALMRNGRVLVVSGSGNDSTVTNFQAGVFDPQTGTTTTQPVNWDMFCNGMVVLPDGRVFVNGGTLRYDPFDGEFRTSVYDPLTGLFTDLQNMAHGRWYPTVTLLGDGTVMTFSGILEAGGTNTTVEIYTVGAGWSQQFGAGWTPPLYPRMHLLPDGTVFYSAPGTGSQKFDPSKKTWTGVIATTNYPGTRVYGSSVLLPLTPASNYKPRVMILGGSQNPATQTTEIIDLSAANPGWQNGPSMSQARVEMNATILPNGKVLAMGGSYFDEDTSTASLNADLYDPNTNTFSSAGQNAFARVYHSVSLLLPDATVWLTGGNPTRGIYEQHMEIYSPSYLFDASGNPATRPTITSVPATIGYGSAFQIQTPNAANISSIALMRPGSSTHAFDMEQRLVNLSFTTGSGVLNATAPPNANIAPPGYYMLFLLNAAGVPSVASFVQLTPTPGDQPPTATITSPAGNPTITAGQSVSFAGSGSDPDGTISFYSWSFPGGNPSSSGLATPGNVIYSTAGTYVASLTVTDNAGLPSQPTTRTVTVQAPSGSPPTLSSVNPTSASQAQTLGVTLTGTNFQNLATCSFGAGITVNSCTFNSSTQLTANLTVASGAAIGARDVTVTNPDGQSSTLTGGFSVTAGSGFTHIDFTYPDRTSLLAGGWDYLAKTAAGVTRNTEQSGTLAVDYNQTTHPGTIRIPLGSGEIWQTLNNSQNMLLRNLTSDWTSLRLRIAAFNPVANYQQVGLLAYQDDDNYVNVNRPFVDAQVIEMFKEVATATTSVNRQGLANTGNLILRLDRNATTNTYTGMYSTNGGSTWTTLGSTTITLSSPRLAIQVGSNLAGTLPTADLSWVEILTPAPAPPPTLTGANPNTGSQGQTLGVTLTGTNFQSGATCNFGSGITVNSCVFNSATQLTANVTIASNAALGARNIIVTNPDSQGATLTNGFTVSQTGPPSIGSLNPNSGSQGQNLITTITGTNFQTGATCSFGAGITVNTCTLNSTSQLTANLSVQSGATVGARNVTVTNPNTQSATLTNGFTVTQGTGLATTYILTVAVLVNSANTTGYNTNAASPGEFQRYPQAYLDHLQVPYEIIDASTTPPPSNLSSRQLILAGHTGLNLSSAWQTAITNAVSAGTGFVNLDSASSIGTQSHIQAIFQATGSTAGASATSISVPATVIPGGSTPHFIAAMQKKFLGDPAGDIVYAFHLDASGVQQSVSPTVLTGATGTVVANLGSNPLILAKTSGSGRAVHFGSYLYLKADRFGFVQGVDDLFWRSLVWAARKPFVVRGYPRFWAVQMDDTMPGWAFRVGDMYNTSFTGTPTAQGYGGPWKVTGYLFTDNIAPGSAERANVIADIQAGKLEVTPHCFGNIKYGNMYWNAQSGPLSDSQWLTNLSQILAWQTGNGGSDVIPSFSRSLVAHYWDLSNNTGYDLWNTLGFRYITGIQLPGFQFPDLPNDITVYTGTGAERPHKRPFWQYELPPKTNPDENFSFIFADDYTVNSRSGFPPQTFYTFLTHYRDFSKYPRPDFIWPSTNYSQTVASSLDQLTRYTWRHWSGLSPVQIFTHDTVNYEYATAADRQAVIAQGSAWLAANGARHTFMDNLGDYMYARDKSRLVGAQTNANGLQLTFTGNSVTADGVPIQTEALVFYQDVEAVSSTIPAFTGGTTVQVALPTPPPTISSINPNSGPNCGSTSVTITGTSFVSVLSVTFGGSPATYTVQSPTSIVATTPGGQGTVDVTVVTNAGTATAPGAYTYSSTGPLNGHFDFNYPSRTELVCSGWSYVAKTALGAQRNTEQSGALAADYNQSVHPGTIRIPLGSGEMWQSLNNSQNSLFRNLPSNWTSIRLNIASFNPVANYQQVGLLVYQDDDDYVDVNRPYVDGQQIEMFREVGGATSLINRQGLANTGNLILRVDRSGNTYTGMYSTNGGSTWTTLGSTTVTLNNPMLAIEVGSNLAGTLPTADLAWVEIQP